MSEIDNHKSVSKYGQLAEKILKVKYYNASDYADETILEEDTLITEGVLDVLDEAKADLLSDAIIGPYITEFGQQVIIIDKNKFLKWFGE